MGLPPRADALDLGRAGEVIAVGRFVVPSPLARRLAGLAACGGGTVALAPDAARVGRKKGLTMLALTCGAWTSHGPASPQAHEQGNGVWKEENGKEKSEPTKSEENGRTGCPDVLGKKTQQPTRQFQLNR